jgi:hypothetical protein
MTLYLIFAGILFAGAVGGFLFKRCCKPWQTPRDLSGLADFFHEHFSKLLVLAAFILLLLFAHHASGQPAEAKFAEYCTSKSGEAFAAFLGLITGRALTSNGNGNGNGNTPANH